MIVRTMHDSGEDDVGALGLQSDDLSTSRHVTRSVELDLAVDFVPVQDCSLDNVGVVRREGVFHGGDVRHGAAHRHQGVRGPAAIDPVQVGGDRREGLVQRAGRDLPIEPEALGVAHRANINTEPLVDAGPCFRR